MSNHDFFVEKNETKKEVPVGYPLQARGLYSVKRLCLLLLFHSRQTVGLVGNAHPESVAMAALSDA